MKFILIIRYEAFKENETCILSNIDQQNDKLNQEEIDGMMEEVKESGRRKRRRRRKLKHVFGQDFIF